jgi:hypothetical protein
MGLLKTYIVYKEDLHQLYLSWKVWKGDIRKREIKRIKELSTG